VVTFQEKTRSKKCFLEKAKERRRRKKEETGSGWWWMKIQ